jgi:hypothetical protein
LILFVVEGTTMEKRWQELIPEQKRQQRFADWIKPGAKFDSPAAPAPLKLKLKTCGR